MDEKTQAVVTCGCGEKNTFHPDWAGTVSICMGCDKPIMLRPDEPCQASEDC